MSSAIEILKEMQHFWFEGIELNKRNGDEPSFKEFQELNALGEAIVALEQRKDLVEWLEKEISEYNEAIEKRVGSEDNRMHNILTRQVLEEILSMVGEQK